MNKLKHTPGLWKVIGENKNIVKAEERDGEKWKILYIFGRPWSDNKQLQEESQANARLIAAAPEMLECLIEMVTYLDKNELNAIKSKTTFEKIMREIIEKATGISIEEVLK